MNLDRRLVPATGSLLAALALTACGGASTSTKTTTSSTVASAPSAPAVSATSSTTPAPPVAPAPAVTVTATATATSTQPAASASSAAAAPARTSGGLACPITMAADHVYDVTVYGGASCDYADNLPEAFAEQFTEGGPSTGPVTMGITAYSPALKTDVTAQCHAVDMGGSCLTPHGSTVVFQLHPQS